MMMMIITIIIIMIIIIIIMIIFGNDNNCYNQSAYKSVNKKRVNFFGSRGYIVILAANQH